MPHHGPFRISSFALVVAGSIAAASAHAQSDGKSVYHLFNPTPRHLMRELSPDRPDVTESPNTVDAGHIQFETSFISYTLDESEGERAEAWATFPSILKLGILNDADLQLLFTPYTDVRVDPHPGVREEGEGFSDIQIRSKINLWGNDGGKTAAAIIPVLGFPTGADEFSSDHVEGGFIFTYGIELGEGLGLGSMVEFDFLYDDEDDGYDTEIVHTLVLAFDLPGGLGSYVEYVGVATTDAAHEYQAFFTTGVLYPIGQNMILDAGVNIGLNDAAEDVTVFTGMTVRF